jgi:hypothetical protein
VPTCSTYQAAGVTRHGRRRSLAHRREEEGEEAMTFSLEARAPPQASLL